MPEFESRMKETPSSQIILPMTVGILFLAVLVFGALLG
jgi:hypothetical protein